VPFSFGNEAEKILKDMDKKSVEEFRTLLRSAYVDSAVYMQGKFPLHNLLLRCLSAIDPIAQGHAVTFLALKKLATFFPIVISEE
jgi:hypothetical protein